MKHKQGEEIFLINSIVNLDGFVDLGDEPPQTFRSPKSALKAAKEVAGEYGLRTYVYKCIPIFRVDRGKLVVTKL